MTMIKNSTFWQFSLCQIFIFSLASLDLLSAQNTSRNNGLGATINCLDLDDESRLQKANKY
jgi:hypothetical protein